MEMDEIAKKDAKSLLKGIIAATEKRDFSIPAQCVLLPFPSVRAPPLRFQMEESSVYGEPLTCFRYMGRTGYALVRRTVLGLCSSNRFTREIASLPVVPDQYPRHPYQRAALWGTMGSGKSYILAALACDLLASFRRSSDGKGFQTQRAVYIPDCEDLVDPEMRAITLREALFLSYADDDKTLEHISMLSDKDSLLKFFQEEKRRGVHIYLIVDQDNALDSSTGDGPEESCMKATARSLINGLAAEHKIVQGASANNRNAKKWHSKQLSVAKVFHHGGLGDDEYKCWKEHFGTCQAVGQQTPLAQLTEEQELRVRDATGCVPLFLQCWSSSSADTPESAWHHFICLPEMLAANSHLKDFIETQLREPSHRETRLEMYTGFLTQGRVTAIPEHYDCRYLYIEGTTGRCVCGLYRVVIAQLLQKLQRSCFLESEWKQAISQEVEKAAPNRALLGFLVEQEMLAQIWQSGIPLYAETILKCNDIVYFTSGSEASLEIKEGCTLYVPSAFNYHRVDAVVRTWWKSRLMYDGPLPTKLEELVNFYDKLPLHVAGVQISLGSLPNHLNSEKEFCSPEAMEVWYHRWDRKNVARWFVWYVWQSEIDVHTKDGVELSPCLYANREVKRKTRASKVQELDHVTVFLAVDQFEPRLKRMKELQS